MTSKHTPGPAVVGKMKKPPFSYTVKVGEFTHYARKKEHADLIAEAIAVATETGLSPAQLAEQRAELIEALRTCLESANAHEAGSLYSGKLHEIVQAEARAILAKCGKVGS